MKSLIITIIFLLICTISSIAQTQEEIDEALEYYPLEVGNSWQYRLIIYNDWHETSDTLFYKVEVVGDSIFSNDHSYKILEVDKGEGGHEPYSVNHFGILGNKSTLNHYFERLDQETANVFRLYENNDGSFRDVLIDSLLSQVGDYSMAARWGGYNIPEISTYHIYKIETEILNMSTFFREFEYLDVHPTTYGLAKGLGFTGYAADGWWSVLVYARINGVEYGEFVEVNVPIDTEHPRSPTLLPNYPNPFNPSTTITFELPEASDVRLSVYGITGQMVGVLVNGHRSAGRHTVQFHAEGLSSGMYLYRLQTGDVVQTRKMLLVK